jgi:hypothetical protein
MNVYYATIIVVIIIIFLLVRGCTPRHTFPIDAQLTRISTIYRCPCKKKVHQIIIWFAKNQKSDSAIVEHTALWLVVLAQYHPELVLADRTILADILANRSTLLEKYSFPKLLDRVQKNEISDFEFTELLVPLFIRVIAGDRALLGEIKNGILQTHKLKIMKEIIIQCIRTFEVQLSLPEISCNCCKNIT